MKLTSVLYSASSYVRGVGNFIRHPFQVIGQQGRRVAQDKLEEAELPMGQGRSPVQRRGSPSGTALNVEASLQERSLGRIATATAPQGLGSEPLQPENQEEIQGRWGRYQRQGEAWEIRGRSHCYSGVLVKPSQNKPVTIQEYELSTQVFSRKEIQERKDKFAALSHLNLRNSGGQDFRIVNLYEAIAPVDPNEIRCYLISEPLPLSQTLRAYLTEVGALPSQQVRQVLDQVLQTLWFLHHQKVRWPNGDVQTTIPHGNLSLDSLRIGYEPLMQDQQIIDAEFQFLIYVTNLSLWEHLFIPPHDILSKPSPAQDLVDLGYVGFDLLTGRSTLTEKRPNLYFERSWEGIEDQMLKQFIRQLVSGDFQADVEKARKTLLSLPYPNLPAPNPTAAETQAAASAHRNPRLIQLIVLGLAGAILGSLIWLGWRGLVGRSPAARLSDYPCCLSEIPGLPQDSITYITEEAGIWSQLLQAQNLVAFGQSLEQTLQERDSRLRNYRLQVVSEPVLSSLQSGDADFALTEWIEDLPEGFAQQEVAYDGLVVFVAFSDARRSPSVPQILNGKITLEQLRQIYGESSESWLQSSQLKDWSVQQYRPTDPVALALFEQLVLEKNMTTIEQFHAASVSLSPTQMLGEILKDYEQRETVGIGFARLSQVINQCAVYPLAIGARGQEVQVLIQHHGQPIDPTTNLCGHKGSYHANVSVFRGNSSGWQQTYPLRYRLAVVYPQDSLAGQRFAEALKTDEGQYLLRTAGLVPIRPIE
jgi:hypothetical protein